MKKKIHVIGGGTISHVRTHFAVAARAYGKVARQIAELASARWGEEEAEVCLHLTKMANSGEGSLETNEDVRGLLKTIVNDPTPSVVFMSAAMVDYTGSIVDDHHRTLSGKNAPRLASRNGEQMMHLTPAPKIIEEIRKYRKDIFLIGFKTTSGTSEDELFLQSLGLVKGASCNLVLGNDVKTRMGMIVTPEQARYHVTNDRDNLLHNLVDMSYHRSGLNFTRSTVGEGKLIPWSSPHIPDSYRKVMDHCIAGGAYRPFRGKTPGHGAIKVDPGKFLTTVRSTNYNQLAQNGLVMVETVGDDTVVAHGAKPSVGGQSQRIVFADHPDMDCIIHFHSKMKPGSSVPVISQREFECGSHECGRNTSVGMKQFGNVWAVMLDKHGPNVIFNRDADPAEVIKFIDDNFDLPTGTDELVPARQSVSETPSLEI